MNSEKTKNLELLQNTNQLSIGLADLRLNIRSLLSKLFPIQYRSESNSEIRSIFLNYYNQLIELETILDNQEYLLFIMESEFIMTPVIASLLHTSNNNLNFIDVKIENPELLPKCIFEPDEIVLIKWILNKENFGLLNAQHNTLDYIAKSIVEVLNYSNDLDQNDLKLEIKSELSEFLQFIKAPYQKVILSLTSLIILEILRNQAKYGVTKKNEFKIEHYQNQVIFVFSNEIEENISIQSTKLGQEIIRGLIESINNLNSGLKVNTIKFNEDKSSFTFCLIFRAKN